MTPVSSRARAVLEFPWRTTLFLNTNNGLATVAIEQYQVRAASAAFFSGTSQQDTHMRTLLVVFYNKHDDVVVSSKIRTPSSWTPQLFLHLLFDESIKTTNSISLFRIDERPHDEIFQLSWKYFNSSVSTLNSNIESSLGYSYISGGF